MLRSFSMSMQYTVYTFCFCRNCLLDFFSSLRHPKSLILSRGWNLYYFQVIIVGNITDQIKFSELTLGKDQLAMYLWTRIFELSTLDNYKYKPKYFMWKGVHVGSWWSECLFWELMGEGSSSTMGMGFSTGFQYLICSLKISHYTPNIYSPKLKMIYIIGDKWSINC